MSILPRKERTVCWENLSLPASYGQRRLITEQRISCRGFERKFLRQSSRANESTLIHWATDAASKATKHILVLSDADVKPSSLLRSLINSEQTMQIIISFTKNQSIVWGGGGIMKIFPFDTQI